MDKDQKLQRLIELAKLADALTTTQAREFVDLLITSSKKQKEELVKQFNDFADGVSHETYRKINEAVQIVSEKHKDALLEVRQLTNKQKKQHEDAMNEALALLEDIKSIEVKDGKDGKDAEVDYEKIVGNVLSQIPEQEAKEPDELVDEINESTKQIKKERVEGLSDIERIAKANAGGSSTTMVNGKLSKNINFNGATVSYSGDVATVTVTGGSGAVDSVNGQTGDVVLDADDIDDTSTTNKFVTAGDITNLSNLSGTNTGDQDLSGLLALDQTLQQTIANDTPILGALSASQILATDTDKAIMALSTATYPSLTELSYVKGVTSAIQTQLNAKGTLSNVVEDTTPQLGGDLDLNGHVITGMVIGTDVQAYDADLTTWAGLTPSANAQSLVTAANYAAMRALLDLEAGTDFYSISAADAAFQPLDSDLTTIAGLTATTNNFMVAASSAWSSMTPTNATALLDAMVGDSGSGGTKGLVPAPSTGDATKFLKGDGTWATPSGSSVSFGSDNQIPFTNSGGTDFDYSSNLTFDGSIFTLTSPVTTGATTSSGFVESFNSLTSGTGQYIASNSLTSGKLLQIVSTSTTLASGNAGIDIAFSGANGSSSIPSKGINVSMTNTGTGSTNYGIYSSASGGSTNYAGYFVSNGTGATGVIGIENTNSNGLATLITAFAPNLSAGQGTYMFHGKAVGSLNAAYTYFQYVGTSNSANRYGIGFSGGSDVLNLFAGGTVSIGTSTSYAKLGILSTTEQLRLLYNASNYLSTTIGSTGTATFDLTGTAKGFIFNEAGGDVDFRIESDTVTNAFFLDGANGALTFGAYGSGSITGTATYNLAVDSSGNVIEVSVPTSINWSEVTGTSQSGAVNSGYICNNAALVTVTVPTTAAVGTIIRIAGKGAGGWKLAQNASQNIRFGTQVTTTGTGGYLASSDQYDCVEVLCTVADTTWTVLSSIGNITYV